MQKIADGESITAVTEAAPVAVEAPAEVEASVESEPVAEAPEEPAEEIPQHPKQLLRMTATLLQTTNLKIFWMRCKQRKLLAVQQRQLLARQTPAADSDGGDDLFDIHVAPAAASRMRLPRRSLKRF